MKIQRKTKNIVTSPTTLETKLPQNKKLGYGKYRFPNIDVVPADQYYSIIEHIEDTVTARSNKKAIVVYYDIAKFSDVYRKANKLFKNGEKLKKLYIKQVYPLDSDAYRLFLEAMYDALNLSYEEDIALMDCVGQTECIFIGYTSSTGVGGIQKRYPWNDEDFIYLYQENNPTNINVYGDCDLEYDEYGNII